MSVHVVPLRIYFIIFASLMGLTAVTVAAAYLDLGALNTVVALIIAVSKATLVILYFMHVRYSPSLTKLVVAGAVLWLLILLALTMTDYVSRGWLPIPGT
jgi:cytochrome c oxidase subunit 4